MLEHAAESLVHTTLSAVALMLLFRLWRLDEPSQRVRFQLAALGVGALSGPALLLLAPARAGEAFREESALFACSRFAGLPLLGSDARSLAVLALVGLGVLLYLRDLVAMLHEPWRKGTPRERSAPPGLAAELAPIAARLRLARPPRIRVVESPEPALFCSGLLRPAVVVSEGLLERLTPAEHRAALSHELAHLAARDPLLGWLLMLLRTLFFFNPAVQLLARAIAFDLERRADDRARLVTGEPLELAAALVKSHRHARSWLEQGAVPGLDGAIAMLEGFRARALETRCRLLMAERPKGLRLPGWHVASVTGGLAVLLYFVV